MATAALPAEVQVSNSLLLGIRVRGALERGLLLLGHRVRVAILGERAASNLLRVLLQRLDDGVAQLRIALDEARRAPLVEAEHVMPDEHLPVRLRAGADSDRRHPEGPGCRAPHR